MSTSFRSLPADRALREAICILLDMRTETKGTPNLVVTETDGSFAGLLTPRSLLQALLKSWQPDESLRRDEAWLAHSLLQLVRGRLDTAIGELMIRDLPRAQPGDRLLRLVELISDRRLECVPVVEDERPVGVLLQADVFRAAAGLVLAPDEAGDPPASPGLGPPPDPQKGDVP
jgi:CBS domain-containing protein